MRSFVVLSRLDGWDGAEQACKHTQRNRMEGRAAPCVHRMRSVVVWANQICFRCAKNLISMRKCKSGTSGSQEHQIPVYALTPEIVGKGTVWKQARDGMKVFETAFRTCAERVLALTN